MVPVPRRPALRVAICILLVVLLVLSPSSPLLSVARGRWSGQPLKNDVKAAAVSAAEVDPTALSLHVPSALNLCSCLVKAYPDAVCGCHGQSDNPTVAFCDGSVLPFGQQLRAQLSSHREAGRVRHEPFFEKLYGSGIAEVGSDIITVPWPVLSDTSATIRVTKRHGVAERFKLAGQRLRLWQQQQRAGQDANNGIKQEREAEVLVLSDAPEAWRWRAIRGEARFSPHAWGIAIDIGARTLGYWRRKPSGSRGSGSGSGSVSSLGLQRPHKRMPQAIVNIFTSLGFIHGGLWRDHFDEMHFEYRPELFVPPCAAIANASWQRYL